MLYPNVCICTVCVQSPRRALDSHEQELQMTVSIRWGLGTDPGPLQEQLDLFFFFFF